MLEPLLSTLNNMRIVLATGSKQRIELMQKMKLKFEVHPSDFAENLDVNQFTYADYVTETAFHKVQSVYQKLQQDESKPDIIIGMDTMIWFDNKLVGKPKNEEDAIQIITRLANGKDPHFVVTGVVINYKGKVFKLHDQTSVYMKQLTKEEILYYVSTGEPMGKAGAYAIQGIGGTFVEKINGDYNNVVGVPICKLVTKLKEIINEKLN